MSMIVVVGFVIRRLTQQNVDGANHHKKSCKFNSVSTICISFPKPLNLLDRLPTLRSPR